MLESAGSVIAVKNQLAGAAAHYIGIAVLVRVAHAKELVVTCFGNDAGQEIFQRSKSGGRAFEPNQARPKQGHDEVFQTVAIDIGYSRGRGCLVVVEFLGRPPGCSQAVGIFSPFDTVNFGVDDVHVARRSLHPAVLLNSLGQ
jgi:hypothetical protein